MREYSVSCWDLPTFIRVRTGVVELEPELAAVIACKMSSAGCHDLSFVRIISTRALQCHSSLLKVVKKEPHTLFANQAHRSHSPTSMQGIHLDLAANSRHSITKEFTKK